MGWIILLQLYNTCNEEWQFIKFDKLREDNFTGLSLLHVAVHCGHWTLTHVYWAEATFSGKTIAAHECRISLYADDVWLFCQSYQCLLFKILELRSSPEYSYLTNYYLLTREVQALESA